MTREETQPDAATEARRPGPDSTLGDVRNALIEEGVAMLSEVGVDLGLDRIKLADVIASAGVGRSSAYRSLADPELSPQQVLHREIMGQILRSSTRQQNRTVVAAATSSELERQADNLASDDPKRRRYAVQSVIRVGAHASFTEITRSKSRIILTTAYGAFTSSDSADWQREGLAASERLITENFSDMYITLSELAGYRLRDGMSVDRFAVIAAALVEGLAMRHAVSDQLGPVMRPTGLNGELEEWSAYGMAFQAIYDMWFEPIEPADN